MSVPGNSVVNTTANSASVPANAKMDDPSAFLLANCISMGQAGGDLSNDLDFDMEWAYYSLMDEEDVVNHDTAPSKLPAAPGEEVGDKRKLGNTDGTVDEPEGKRAKGKATWRKYGQKTLKGKEYVGMRVLRCYYRCNFPGCTVKKQVETSSWSNEPANITIHGIHNHQVEDAPAATESNPGDAETGAGAEAEGTDEVRIVQEPKPTPPLDQNFADLVVRAHPHFVVADPNQEDCPIIFASDGFCQLTGYSLEETVGRNCRFLQGKDTNPNAVRQLTKAIRNNQEIHIILLNYKKDRTPFWNLLHISPIIVDGKLHSIVGAQLDVSGLVEGHRDLQRSTPQASALLEKPQ